MLFHLRQNVKHATWCKNYTREKASLINLPLVASNSIKGYLYRCFFNIQEQNGIFNNTGSYANTCKFDWGIDGNVTFRHDKMLLSMPKHYTLRCGGNSKCTKRCRCKKNEEDCTEFCKCKWLCDKICISLEFFLISVFSMKTTSWIY